MADPTLRSRWRDQALLLGHFVRHPATIGTVTPSSRFLARLMVHALDPSGPQTVVELGPGTGAFTEHILMRLGPQGRFLAVELEPEFVSQLRARFPDVTIACASAADLPRLVRDYALGPIDHIVSGLPFATLPPDITRQILDGIQQVLRPGGTFTTFQYVYAYTLPRARSFRQELSRRLRSAPSRTVTWRNFPPAFALSWRAG